MASRTLLALCVLAFACGGEAPAAAPGGATVDAKADDSREDSRPVGDPLLDEARQSLRGGELSAEVRAQLSASNDPAHARARRILAVMDRQARGEPEPSGDAGPDTNTKIEAPPSVPSEPTPDVTAPAQGGGEVEGEPEAVAKLAVLTRLSLTKKGRRVTLTVHAASPLKVGLVEQASGTARLVVESAGALPAALQARPEAAGIVITDVRRGQDTVQIAISVGEGWSVGRPRGFPGGAKLEFTEG